MAGAQRLLAIAIAVSLTGVPRSNKPNALGIVAQAVEARLGSEPVAEGTTIYNGDTLATGAGGSLRLLVGDGMLYLADQSSVALHDEARGTAKEFQAELLSGAVVLFLTANTVGEIKASSASVRPLAETRGVVRVQIIGPHELIVLAQRGPAQISYRGESETIPEGKSYRVLLNPEDNDPSRDAAPKEPQKRRRVLLLIAIGAAAATAISIPLWAGTGKGAPGGTLGGVESPDRP
ncbi:MAG TPA: hypothetical protein VE077_21825 [Candidatus Methylomirabilis sp.]|nr:hypothetical protein [Candidatus Methylomirabilis sp.]